MEATATKFKPILLSKNDKVIELTEIHLSGLADMLNQAVKEIELFLEIKLNDTEKVESLEEGIDWVINHLKESFPFPNANVQFNLEALGKDISDLKLILGEAKSTINNPDIGLIDSEFRLTNEGKKKLKDQFSVFTKYEAQNVCFNMALKLSKVLNEAIEKGYYNNYDQNQFKGILKIVHQEKYLGDFTPNFNQISKMREDGQFTY